MFESKDNVNFESKDNVNGEIAKLPAEISSIVDYYETIKAMEKSCDLVKVQESQFQWGQFSRIGTLQNRVKRLEDLLEDIYDEIKMLPAEGCMRMVDDAHLLQLEARIRTALGLAEDN